MTTIIYTLAVSFGLALFLGFLLGFFKEVFYVPVDETVGKVRDVLPGANCGGCGYPGCDGFAAAVAVGDAPVSGCTAGGVPTAQAVGRVMGVTANAEQYVAVRACQGSKECAVPKGTYIGVKTCKATKTLGINGTKMCSYGCVGFGDCVTVCKFDAVEIEEDGLPHIDYAKCTGCGMCVKACPQFILSTVPSNRKGAIALCTNRNPNKTVILKQCKTGCIKCGKCEKNCPEKAIVVTNGIPVVDYTKCTSCGECIKGCPTHVLALVEDIVK